MNESVDNLLRVYWGHAYIGDRLKRSKIGWCNKSFAVTLRNRCGWRSFARINCLGTSGSAQVRKLFRYLLQLTLQLLDLGFAVGRAVGLAWGIDVALGEFCLRLIHAIDDDADHQIEHDHRAEQNEGNEIDGSCNRCGFRRAGQVGDRLVVALIDIGAIHLQIHHIGPVFEGDDAEE